MLSEAQIKAKIEELNAKRDDIINEANKSLAYLNGQIQALEDIINPKPEVEPEKVEEPKG